MKKLCIFFLISACSNHLASMDQFVQLPQTSFLPIHIIEKEIRDKHLVNQLARHSIILLKHKMRDEISRFRNVNRSWRDFFDWPVTFRTIISLNIRQHSPQVCYDDVINDIGSIAIPAAELYCLLSQRLNENINTLGPIDIKNYMNLGADVNYGCGIGIHRIPPALITADRERTSILLELGADPNIEFRGITPLSQAIYNEQAVSRAEQLARISLLLAYNPSNKCLIEAVDIKDKKILELLLQKKNIPMNQIDNAIHRANIKDFPVGLELLKTFRRDIIKKSKYLYTFVHSLSIDEINALLDTGAMINYREKGKRPILMLTLDDYEKTELLLSHGADPNIAFHRRTPLMLAMKQRDIRLTQLFLAYKPKDLCLTTLVSTNNPEMAQLFIKNGLTQKDIYKCLCDSLVIKKMKILPVFLRAYQHFELITHFLEAFERTNIDREQGKNILTITDLMWDISKKDFDTFKENELKQKT